MAGMMLDRRAALASLGAGVLAPPIRAAAPRLPMPPAALWDPPARPLAEGMAPGPNGPIFWRSVGHGPRDPVVALHGGPAAGHRYMRPYAGLARGRRVIFYDQSGCGRSASPSDLRLYTLDRYVAELEALRAHLGIERMALLGHSWGGLLAPAYAAAHPGRVSAMVLAGSAPRWRDFQAAADRWLAELGPQAAAIVRRAERTGQTDSPAYRALTERYYALHLCRLDPPPAWFQSEGQKIGRNRVYRYLNGPTEFQFTGAFAGLDMTPLLPKLRMPTLVTCGEYDEGPPWVAHRLAALLPDARVQVFAGLSHMSHIEDPARVMRTTGTFLDRHV